MQNRIYVFALLILAMATGCKKESIPTEGKGYNFTYRVKISNKINEPTIISGFYGKVMEYKGDFMPKVSETGEAVKNQPRPATNQILLFDSTNIEAINTAAFQEKGITFYDLKKLEKEDIKPKYIIEPNKNGFYQFDLGSSKYYVLLKLSKSKGYYNGGVQLLEGTVSTLKQLEMRIDHNATF